MPLYFVYKVDENNCINTDKPIKCFRRCKDAIKYCSQNAKNAEYFIEGFSKKRGYINEDVRSCYFK